jgi:hypothetical protein
LVEAVAGAGNGDDIGAVEESVEDGAGCGDVAEELAPFFDGAVGGHDGGAVFVSAHYDFQEDFAAAGGEIFEAHVVDDEEVWFEEKALEAGVVGGGSIGGDVADEVEDGSIEDMEPGSDGFGSEGLVEVGFPDSGRADEEGVAFLADEVAGGEFVDAGAGDGGVEGEVFQAAGAAEGGGFGAAQDLALLANVDFVLEDKFQEVGVGQVVALGFLEAHVEALEESGEAECAGVVFEGCVGVHCSFVCWWMKAL